MNTRFNFPVHTDSKLRLFLFLDLHYGCKLMQQKPYVKLIKV